MKNLHTVFLIMLGTYICSSSPEAFIAESGDYYWLLGLVMGIAMFGVLSLLDLALVGAKHGVVLVRHFLKEIKEWLK